MKKIVLILSVIVLCIIIFSMRTGITYELQLWSERVHFTCYSLSKEGMTGCINKYYYELAKNSGASTAISDVKMGYGKYPNLRRSCHSITHTIGRTASESNRPIGVLFAEGDPFCWSGYYHGVVEGNMRGVKPESITKEFVNNFCNDIPKTEANYFHYFNCTHGTGHAFMYVSRNNLPLALSNCETFIDDDDKQNCAAGAFMENIVASQSDHGTEFIRPDEPYFPCTLLKDSPFRETCYTTQATLIWQRATRTEDAFLLCEKIHDKRSQHLCFEGLGREIAAANMNTTAGTIQTCSVAPSADIFSICIVGAMKNFISYYHDDVLAKQLCASIPTPIRELCDTERSVFIRLFASSTSAQK